MPLQASRDDVYMDDKFVEMALLYDFYGRILTPRQREIVEYYYMKDYSLTEIGDLLDISRQAVYDNLKRAKKQLSAMERNLGLVNRFHSEYGEWTDTINRLKDIIKILDGELDKHDLAEELRHITEFICRATGG